jgi:uncharacterized protein (TIGR03118 family)
LRSFFAFACNDRLARENAITAAPARERLAFLSSAMLSPPKKEVAMHRLSRAAMGVCTVGVVAILGLHVGGAGQPPLNFYQQHNLTSDGFINADNNDPNLVNPWGLVFNPTGPWWVGDNGGGVATLYPASGSPASLVVAIPTGAGDAIGGNPTGIVFNGGGGFVVSDGTNSGAARFIFATEDGTIVAWAPAVPPPSPSTQAFTVVPAPGDEATGAVYMGLAIGNNGEGDFLYATDFHNAKIDVYDSSFHAVAMAGGFSDPNLPEHFAPFGIRNIDNVLYVTYAMQDAVAHDDVAGPGLGVVDVYDLNGNLLRRLTAGGRLNSPWGLALAPSNFGKFSGALLVGNFGDGHINAYDPSTGETLGPLLAPKGGPVTIEGLWGLSFGNDASAGPKHVLFFTAGSDHEAHGLFGSLTAVPPSGHAP